MGNGNELRSIIYSDIEKCGYSKDLKGLFHCYFERGGGCYKYVYWLRRTYYYKQHRNHSRVRLIFAYLCLKYYERKYNVHINSNIYIGNGFRVVHGSGVFGNAKYIGDNCTLYQSVTLGSSPNGGIPTINDNVTIYTGAVISGDVTIGDNCIIGANAVITKDVPPNTCVKLGEMEWRSISEKR